MIIGFLLKAIRRVKPHIRKRRAVVGYVQRGRPKLKDTIKRANALFTQHYEKITAWAWQSVRHQIAKGEHIGSLDDAQIQAEQAAFEALRNYKPSKGGTLETYVRPQIKYAVLQHMRWERSRGVTGIRALYAKVSSAKDSSEKERLIGEFPKMEAVGDESAFTPGSDEVIEAAQALLSRDEVLDQLGRELGSSLEKVKLRLKQIEKKKGTWNTKTFTKRKLQGFRYKLLENMSFREVADKMGMDVAHVHKDYTEVRGLLDSLNIDAGDMPADLRGRAVHERAPMFRDGERWDSFTNRWHKIEGGPVKDWKQMSRAERDKVRRRVGLKKSLGDFKKERIKWNLERLRQAVGRGYPESHIGFVTDVLSGLLAEHDRESVGKGIAIVVKAMPPGWQKPGHTWIKREGTSGSYRYTYPNEPLRQRPDLVLEKRELGDFVEVAAEPRTPLGQSLRRVLGERAFDHRTRKWRVGAAQIHDLFDNFKTIIASPEARQSINDWEKSKEIRNVRTEDEKEKAGKKVLSPEAGRLKTKRLQAMERLPGVQTVEEFKALMEYAEIPEGTEEWGRAFTFFIQRQRRR